MFREFADLLLANYRIAKRVACDQRLSESGRQRRAAELDEELLDLCSPRWFTHQVEETGWSRPLSESAQGSLLTRIILDVDKPDEAELTVV